MTSFVHVNNDYWNFSRIYLALTKIKIVKAGVDEFRAFTLSVELAHIISRYQLKLTLLILENWEQYAHNTYCAYNSVSLQE